MRAAWAVSVLHTSGDVAAIFGELLHHRLMKRDVLLRRAIRAGMNIQFATQLLAGAKAGVEVEQLSRSTMEDCQLPPPPFCDAIALSTASTSTV
jgi:hypothetical protein